ncbi:hypothetical protein [Stenotrophomonas bentonitica]
MNTENPSLERNDENTNLCESTEQRERLLDEIYEATADSMLNVLERIADKVSWHFLLVGVLITIIHLAIPIYIFGLHIFSLICWSISLVGLIILIVVREIKASEEIDKKKKQGDS